MRRLAAALLFSICAIAIPAAHGQKYRIEQIPKKPNPADYPLKVHISAIRFRPCASAGFSLSDACERGIFADASLDGKKVELSGPVNKRSLKVIVPGDYLARLAEEKPRDAGKAVLFQEYFVLLPDKKVWLCEITGFSE